MRMLSIFVANALCMVLVGAVASAAGSNSFENPTSSNSISTFIENVLRAVVYIALPIVALFMVYAGFLFVKARGNSGQIEEAKNNFVAVVLGAILILGAWVFATLIAGTVSQILGGK